MDLNQYRTHGFSLWSQAAEKEKSFFMSQVMSQAAVFRLRLRSGLCLGYARLGLGSGLILVLGLG